MERWVELAKYDGQHFYLVTGPEFSEEYVENDYFLITQLPIPKNEANFLKMLHPRLADAVEILSEVRDEDVKWPQEVIDGIFADFSLRIVEKDGKWLPWC